MSFWEQPFPSVGNDASGVHQGPPRRTSVDFGFTHVSLTVYSIDAELRPSTVWCSTKAHTAAFLYISGVQSQCGRANLEPPVGPKGGEPHCIEHYWTLILWGHVLSWILLDEARLCSKVNVSRRSYCPRDLLIDPLAGFADFAAAPGMVELLSAAHGRVFWRSYRSCSRSLPAQRNWSPSNRMWTALPGSQLPWATSFWRDGAARGAISPKAIGPYHALSTSTDSVFCFWFPQESTRCADFPRPLSLLKMTALRKTRPFGWGITTGTWV